MGLLSRSKRHRPDYLKIAQMEEELGLPPTVEPERLVRQVFESPIRTMLDRKAVVSARADRALKGVYYAPIASRPPSERFGPRPDLKDKQLAEMLEADNQRYLESRQG